jgi:methyl-accepting chemotaxis protein
MQYEIVSFNKRIPYGDLTKQIDNKFKDESRILVEVLNTTGNKLKEIMINIKEVSKNVNYSSNQLSTSLEDSNISMDAIGYSISEIGINIEEVTNL